MVKYIKFYFLLLLVFSCYAELHSQSFIGITVNPNISKDVNFNHYSNPYEPLFVCDYNLSYSYSFNKKFSLSTGIGYSVKGYKIDLDLFNPIEPDPLLTGRTGEVINKNQVIEIPILLGYYFINNDHILFYSEIGLLNTFPFKEELGSSGLITSQKNGMRFYTPGAQINVGFGIKTSKNFKFKISPTLKYLIHSTSENIAKCYSIGTQFGVEYKLTN